jgi:hypothetical protein
MCVGHSQWFLNAPTMVQQASAPILVQQAYLCSITLHQSPHNIKNHYADYIHQMPHARESLVNAVTWQLLRISSSLHRCNILDKKTQIIQLVYNEDRGLQWTP